LSNPRHFAANVTAECLTFHNGVSAASRHFENQKCLQRQVAIFSKCSHYFLLKITLILNGYHPDDTRGVSQEFKKSKN